MAGSCFSGWSVSVVMWSLPHWDWHLIYWLSAIAILLALVSLDGCRRRSVRVLTSESRVAGPVRAEPSLAAHTLMTGPDHTHTLIQRLWQRETDRWPRPLHSKISVYSHQRCRRVWTDLEKCSITSLAGWILCSEWVPSWSMIYINTSSSEKVIWSLFFTGENVIMELVKNVSMDYWFTITQLLSSLDINWWTGVVWITCGLLWCFYQMFGLSFWRHPFTAEHPLLRHWCNATFLQIWWRNKLIYILDDLRMRAFLAHFHFWVN